MHAAVANGATDISSNTDFFLPYFSVGTERLRETYSLVANTQFESNMAGFAGTQHKDFAALGRFDADRHFSVLRWNINGSLWLDPIFYGKEWEEAKVWWKATRSHEIAATFRGQSAVDGARLVPQMEAVVGGFDTVRGYPESYTAADTAVISSFEYRFHVARQCIEPESERAHKTKNTQQRNSESESPTDDTDANPSSFAFRPPVAASVADWDLIFRTFIDYAQARNNKMLPGVEANRNLLGAGFGVELQTYKPSFCAIRADVGIALRGDHQIPGDHVDAGDARLHVTATFAW
jgi:hemolysin activation/secretion protein